MLDHSAIPLLTFNDKHFFKFLLLSGNNNMEKIQIGVMANAEGKVKIRKLKQLRDEKF